MDLDEMLGDQVTLHGIAADAHAGAVIQLDDGAIVYVADLPAWEERWTGREIALTGVLGRERLGPEPTVGETGGHSHGQVGHHYVLRDATWQLP